MSGLRNGSGGLLALVRASFNKAQKPAQVGALKLVPPNCCATTFRTTVAPVLGSASELTSGTSLCVPLTPAPVCHAGRGKKILLPPPLPVQPVSLDTLPLAASLREVPPTPITLGSEDSYSA